MKQEKIIWITLGKDKLHYYKLHSVWDDNTGFVYDILSSIVSWLDQTYEELNLAGGVCDFPVWVSLTEPSYNKNEQGEVIVDHSIWGSPYKIKPSMRPEFSISDYTDEEIRELSQLRDDEC